MGHTVSLRCGKARAVLWTVSLMGSLYRLYPNQGVALVGPLEINVVAVFVVGESDGPEMDIGHGDGALSIE